MPRSRWIPACLAALLGSCATSEDPVARSEFFAQQQNHFQAYWVVAQALDSYPEEAELERVFWERRLSYLLDRGQELVFEEQELEAIAEFQKALALDPDNQMAKQWILRAKTKLAKESVRQADTLRHEGRLGEALKAYNRATYYVPEFAPAIEGIQEVNERYQVRSDKAMGHYVLGSRAQGDQRYQQSYYHSGLAEDLDQTLSKAKSLRSKAAQRLARERLERGKEMEAKGFYHAALMQYRSVARELPDAPGLAQRIAAMEREVEVSELCREAEMLVRKKEFEKAQGLLEKAFDKSELEKARVSGLILDARRRRYEASYRKARDLELEYQYEAALEAYREIAKAWEKEDFMDVAGRISELQNNIKEALTSYQAGRTAEEKGNTKDAIDNYKDALLVYPGFRDCKKRIADLQGK